MSNDVDIAVMETRIDQIEKGIVSLERVVNNIHDRIPNWAVWAFAGASGVIGSLITLLAMCVKF